MMMLFEGDLAVTIFDSREPSCDNVILSAQMLIFWRGGRVAEGNGLLNRRSGYTATAGSNPALSVFSDL